MIKKIIFFDVNVFNERDYKRFGIDILKKRGFEVEFWCVRFLLTKNMTFSMQEAEELGVYNWQNLKIIHNFAQFKSELKKINKKNTIIANSQSFKFKIFSIMQYYALLRINRLKYFNFTIAFDDFNRKRLETTELFTKFIFGKLLYAPIFNFLPTKRKFKFYVPRKKTKDIYIHAFDYDVYLENKNLDQKPEYENYILFLDEYLPFHSDFSLRNVSTIINDVDSYYDDLCNFFEFIESKYNCNVIIAAHPKSDYQVNYYKGRKIVKNRTAELVKNSNFVIASASLSSNYTVIYDKPVLHILDKQSSSSPILSKTARNFFKSNKIIPLSLSQNYESINIEKRLKESKKYYDFRKNEYIKINGTEERYYWDIVADYIEKTK